MKYEKEKFKSLVHYIIFKFNNKRNITRTVLFKLLYFSEFNYYEIKERLITGESYLKWKYDPAPKDFIEIKEELIAEDKIKENKEVLGYNYKKYSYTSLTDASTSIFSEDELDCINATLDKLSHMSASQISVYSHRDMPWQAAELNEEIEPEFVFYRNPEYCLRVYEDE